MARDSLIIVSFDKNKIYFIKNKKYKTDARNNTPEITNTTLMKKKKKKIKKRE